MPNYAPEPSISKDGLKSSQVRERERERESERDRERVRRRGRE